MNVNHDVISVEDAQSLAGLFRERVKRSPNAPAYRFFCADKNEWVRLSWVEMAEKVDRFQSALAKQGFSVGDRVAIMLPNGCDWVVFDQAALGLGLVTVPLYTNDRAENIAHILAETETRLLFIDCLEHWDEIQECINDLPKLQLVLSVTQFERSHEKLKFVSDWLVGEQKEWPQHQAKLDDLATIVYTSGTTGRPKGVCLSHKNILSNAFNGQMNIPVMANDLFLSFLPLSHTLERSIGYYLPMMAGASVAFARSIPLLAEDLLAVKPTILISVPRIYERIYRKVVEAKAQKSALQQVIFDAASYVGWIRFLVSQRRISWRPELLFWPLLNQLVAQKITSKLGGRLRVAICGGAPLSQTVSKLFVSLGVPLMQGYGLTETSPVLSVNKLHDSDPVSVGVLLPGVKVKFSENEELMVKSPGLMLGYWKNQQATDEVINSKGWFHTGDKARLENNHLYITGRIKEIIVLANGEKLSPLDVEEAIAEDPIFEQVMIVGEGKPFLLALVVLNREILEKLCVREKFTGQLDGILDNQALIQFLHEGIKKRLLRFPGYVRVHGLVFCEDAWTPENGMLTPTLKLKRNVVIDRYRDKINDLYQGH